MVTRRALLVGALGLVGVAAAGSGSVVHISKGCHNGTFWQAPAPEQMRVIGGALGA